MVRPLALLGPVCVTVALLWASPSLATTVPALTPAQVADKSDVVVTGVVVARETAWAGRRIFTFVTLRVDGVVRGALSEREREAGVVRIAVPGGEVAGIGQKVPGAPVLEKDVRYAVCLSPATGPAGARGVMYFFAGVWRLDSLDGGVAYSGNHDGVTATLPSADLLGALRGSTGASAP